MENNNENYIYDNIQPGDIIWAKRYTNEKEENQIPIGHKEGPYVVFGKDEYGLKCLYGTSTPPKSDFLYYKVLVLNNKSYYLPKTSYIQINDHSYITQDRFIKRLSHLNNEDIKMLYKKIDIAYRDGVYYNMDIDTPIIPLEAGDIISNGVDKYLIIGERLDKYECLKLLEEQNGLEFSIIVDSQAYYLNFDSPKLYSKLFDPIRINFIDNKTLLAVLAKQKERLNSIKNKKEISRGSLIRLENTLYYIYGEINNEWMLFPVIGQCNPNLHHIIINNKHYYTDFNSVQISKNKEGIEVLALASREEITKIKEQKKSYTKEKQKKEKYLEKIKNYNSIKPEIQCGSIIKFKGSNSQYLHIVILRGQESLITIKYDKYLEGKYLLSKFYLDEIEYVDKLENFDVLKVLYKIKNICQGYINQHKLKMIIEELENQKEETTLTKKLTP